MAVNPRQQTNALSAVSNLNKKLSVAAVANVALAANTYANGQSGQGATLTANANGTISAVDGYTLALNDRLLVNAEAAGANNGIYGATQLGNATLPYILTRTSDFEQGFQFPGSVVVVQNGTNNAGCQYYNTNVSVPTIGTTAISFNLVQGSGIPKTDQFLGNGTTTVFNLTKTPQTTNAADFFVTVDGLVQQPTDDYTVSSTQITFLNAPPAPSYAPTNNIIVRYYATTR